jgi:hypothetical protein
MVKGKQLKAAFNKLKKDKSEIKAPKDLQRRVRARLKQQPTLRWDAAVAEIINKS